MTAPRTLAAEFRRTATARGRADIDAYGIEGLRLFERALAAEAPIVGALLAESFGLEEGSREALLVDRLGGAGVNQVRAPDRIVQELMDGRGGGALVGLVKLPSESTPVPAGPEPHGSQSGAVQVLVGVDIEDPGNVGALVRTALAAGARGYLRVGSGDPFHPKAVRTSMGSLFRLPVWSASAGEDWSETLRRGGYRLLGAATGGGVPLHRACLAAEGTAWVVGSEAFGLQEDSLSRLDEIVSIPMAERVDSFSVNAAAAILLYEGMRRKL